MKLNHLNLTVSDVAETRSFLKKYFGLRSIEGAESDDSFDVMFDDANLVLTLMKVGKAEPKYPASFHIGFIQANEKKVNEINKRLKEDGFDVKSPRRFHGSWTFFVKHRAGLLSRFSAKLIAHCVGAAYLRGRYVFLSFYFLGCKLSPRKTQM